MVSVGFQVAMLLPVIAVAVTTAETPVKDDGSLSVAVAVPVTEITPAEYAILLAAIVGPATGVKALEMAVATHPAPAAAARSSVTTMLPIWALSVVPPEFAVTEPKLVDAGALIESAPPVSVNVRPVPTASAEDSESAESGITSNDVVAKIVKNLRVFIYLPSFLLEIRETGGPLNCLNLDSSQASHSPTRPLGLLSDCSTNDGT
jgi:hypothetical protein